MTSTTTSSTAVRDNGPGRTVSIVGIVLGALGLLLGLITGLPGLICGIVGAAKGNRLGWIAIVVSVIAVVASYAIGFAIIGGHHH
jgi:hypothetical protein